MIFPAFENRAAEVTTPINAKLVRASHHSRTATFYPQIFLNSIYRLILSKSDHRIGLIVLVVVSVQSSETYVGKTCKGKRKHCVVACRVFSSSWKQGHNLLQVYSGKEKSFMLPFVFVFEQSDVTNCRKRKPVSISVCVGHYVSVRTI